MAKPKSAPKKTAEAGAAAPKARARKPKAERARSGSSSEADERSEEEGVEASDEERDGSGDDEDVVEADAHVEAADEDDEAVEADAEVVDDGDEPAPRSSKPPKSEGAALSRTDPLQAYLREVQRHKLLTPEEEKQLTTSYYETQDVKAAARLVTSNLRLVVKLAYEYRRAYKNIMDLIQEGNIGLMQAVKRYDPYRGVKLSSYAAWWIRAYILRFILNNWRLVKLGTTQAQRKLFFNLNKEKAKLAAMGIDATPALIADRLGVEEKEVVDMDRRLSSAEASLDAPIGDSEGRSVSRIDLLPSAGESPEADVARSEMGALIQERLQEFRLTLKGKDIVIFDKRLVAEEPLTLQELGDEFGVSRERVRQLEARIAGKLREYLKQHLGEVVTET